MLSPTEREQRQFPLPKTVDKTQGISGFSLMQSDLFSCFPLRKARVHEVYGPGALGFAAISAAQAQSDVFWVREAWQPETINPVGLSAFFDPSRLLVGQTRDQVEGLAVMEEALRDGSLPLVVIELSQPLDLTAGRRLQLAAKAGNATGLCLIPEGMGSNTAETRWRCAPVFDPHDSTLQSWELIKNKSGTLGTWHVRWNTASRRLRVVSPAGERPGSAGASD
ncbi:ImuA family protein [Stappia sp.]|uniref:ImuA family protein n=1 Tax=Stappia sp. TaxID=1870903 RepID=UPI003A993A92